MNPQPTKAQGKSSAAQQFEDVVLVLILVIVGVSAWSASFTHVHDWTMHNSPEGTGDWFGWANAVISELVPIAALLVMRRRHAAGQSNVYPAALLVAALVLSITAQLAVAKPGFFGGLVSVVPALAFAALAKLVLGKTPQPEAKQETVDTPGIPPVVARPHATDNEQHGELVPAELLPVSVVPSNGQRDLTGLVGTVTR